MDLNKKAAIWAVDLFATDMRLQHEAAAAIRALQRRTALRVRPVYLGTPSPRHPAFRQWAQSRLDELAAGAGIPKNELLALEIMDVIERSVSHRVSALLAFAREHQAGLIVLSTRAHHGPKRWFLGSFADTLSLRSDIPIFVVNPCWKETADFDEILFPTDFSQRSREAYSKVLQFAAMAHLKICVFHKYGSDIGPSWDFNLVPSPGYSEESSQDGESELTEIRRKLESWRRDGESAGVQTAVELDLDSGSVLDALVRRAELSSCIVAMTPQSTRVEAIMLGSITRQMIRESSAPVWVLCEPQAAQVQRPAA